MGEEEDVGGGWASRGGTGVKGWRVGKREEEAGRGWVVCAEREGGRPQRLARAATGTAGGWRDAERAGRGPGNAHGDSATWGGTETWDCGVGAQGDKDDGFVWGSQGE